MAEATRLGYLNLIATPTAATLTFKMLVDHFTQHELDKTEGRIGRKASETVKRDKHNLNTHVTPRWGDVLALEIKPLAIEAWFESLSENLAWQTIANIRSAMSQTTAVRLTQKPLATSSCCAIS